MGKIETYTKNRVEGLMWAYDLIRNEESPEKGVDMLEREIRFRKATFIPLEIPATSIRECSTMLAKRLMNRLLIVFLKIFEDEFEWKTKRLQRLVDLFAKHAGVFFDEDPYGERYVQLSDYAKYYREEHGIIFTDDVLDEMLSVEEQNENKRLRKLQFDVIEKNVKEQLSGSAGTFKEKLGNLNILERSRNSGQSEAYAVSFGKMKAIMKYPGSKWSIAEWIISYFPEHHSYLEPFFGSGAVLFNKPRSHIETVNDLDGNVVNLFEWIKKDPERLAHEIYFTPYARQVYDEAFKNLPEDSFGKAVNFYIRLNMGHGFRTNGEKVGWKNDVQGRERSYASQDWCNLPDKIIQAAERLRGVQIENKPAVEIMQRFNFPNVLIYLDPPYMLGTRHGKQYRCEMEDSDHEELLVIAKNHKGSVLISGYESELYNSILKDWYRKEITCYSQNCSKKREILWMNYEPNRQINLFEV